MPSRKIIYLISEATLSHFSAEVTAPCVGYDVLIPEMTAAIFSSSYSGG